MARMGNTYSYLKKSRNNLIHALQSHIKRHPEMTKTTMYLNNALNEVNIAIANVEGTVALPEVDVPVYPAMEPEITYSKSK